MDDQRRLSMQPRPHRSDPPPAADTSPGDARQRMQANLRRGRTASPAGNGTAASSSPAQSRMTADELERLGGDEPPRSRAAAAAPVVIATSPLAAPAQPSPATNRGYDNARAAPPPNTAATGPRGWGTAPVRPPERRPDQEGTAGVTVPRTGNSSPRQQQLPMYPSEEVPAAAAASPRAGTRSPRHADNASGSAARAADGRVAARAAAAAAGAAGSPQRPNRGQPRRAGTGAPHGTALISPEELEMMWQYRRDFHDRPTRVLMPPYRPLLVESAVLDRRDFQQPLLYCCKKVRDGSSAGRRLNCSPTCFPLGGCCCPRYNYHHYRREAALSLMAERRAAGKLVSDTVPGNERYPRGGANPLQGPLPDADADLFPAEYLSRRASDDHVLGYDASAGEVFSYYDDDTIVSGGDPADANTCLYYLRRQWCVRCAVAQQLHLLFAEAEYRQCAVPSLGSPTGALNSQRIASTTAGGMILHDGFPHELLLASDAVATGAFSGTIATENAALLAAAAAARGSSGKSTAMFGFADPTEATSNAAVMQGVSSREGCCSRFGRSLCTPCRVGSSYRGTVFTIVCLDVLSLFCCGLGCVLCALGGPLACNPGNGCAGCGTMLCNARLRYMMRSRYRISSCGLADLAASVCCLGPALDQQGSELLLHRIYRERPDGYGLGAALCGYRPGPDSSHLQPSPRIGAML